MTSNRSAVSTRPKGRQSTAKPRGITPRNGPSVVVTLAVLALTSVYFLAPVWWLLISSTKSNAGLFSSSGLWFGEFKLGDNLRDVFSATGGLFPRWLGNSLFYAGLGGALATLFGTACGYAIAKYEFRGRGLLFGCIMAGVLLPGALLTVPLYLLFSGAGLVNTYWAVLIPAAVSPFAVYLARIYAAASVPDELIEAARVDGAGEVRIFSTIALRLMSPALVTIFLFTFVGIWNNFFLPLIMLSNERLYPVTLGIYGWYTVTQHATYAIVITGSLLSVIPLVIAFLSLQRFWRSGLAGGGVKI